MRSSNATSVPFERVDDQGSQHVGGVRQHGRLDGGKQSDGEHGLGAVDQRNRLFRFEH